MNKAPLLATAIRTNCAERLLRTISIQRMHYSLMDLFVDRTAIDTSLRRYFSEDAIEQILVYNDCLKLNDENTIDFNNSFSDSGMNPIDENHNMFIPFDSGDNIE